MRTLQPWWKGWNVRIAMVTPYDLGFQGGVQQHVSHLAAELRARGDQVLELGPVRTPRQGQVALGWPVSVPSNGSISRVALAPTAAARTVAALRRLKPDVVHVHEPSVPMVSPAAILGSPAPVVATFHAWAHTDRMYRALRPAMGRLLDRIDARVAVSPAAAAFHGGALGVPSAGFELIPNGVEVSRFQVPAEPSEDPVVLFVGRLAPRKGADVLVRAFPQVHEQLPNARLQVAGDGPDRAALQALVPAELKDHVEFLGRVSDEQLPRLYASADIFVAPARGGESFGIVLVEAMAARTTVVASDIPGYASVVEDGVNGVLVPPEDPAALAATLVRLLADDAARSGLVERAAEHVERYDWSRVTDQVRQVYERVLEA